MSRKSCQMNNRTKQTAYIANKIIELREAVGWSQSELARQARVTSAAISQIEKGDRMPSLIVMRKLADALNVSISELGGEKATSNEDTQIFFRKFGDVKNLNKKDQKIIQSIVKRLKEK